MILELYGLPGSGKTTFAKKMVANDFDVVKIKSRKDLIFWNVVFICLHPWQSVRLFWFLWRFGRAGFFWFKFTNLFLQHNAKICRARWQNKNCIIDQGHFQDIISLFEDVVSADILKSYLKLLPKPDIVFVFEVDQVERARRLAERAEGLRPFLAKEKVDTWQKSSEVNFKNSVNFLSHLGQPFLIITKENIDEFYWQANPHKFFSQVMHYIVRTRLPSDKAHGHQISKMAEAFVAHHLAVVLHHALRPNPIKSDFFDYHNVPKDFSITTGPSVRWLWFISSRLAFRVEGLVWFLFYLFRIYRNKAIYFTRDPEVAWALSLRRQFVIFESHRVPERFVGRYFYGFLVRKSDLVVANSDGTKEALHGIGLDGAQVIVAPNAVDQAVFYPLDQEISRRQLNLPSDRKIIVYTGRFYKWKGVEFLLEAWRAGLEEVADLVLVGGEDSEIEKIRKSYPSERLHLFPIVKNRDLPSYLAAGDILVIPNLPLGNESMYYTSPIKLFEYMAMAKPIVAADLPSLRAIISHEEAVFFEAGNGPDLVKKIKDLIVDQEQIEILSEKALHLSGNFTWRGRAKKILDFVKLLKHEKTHI